MRPQSGLRRASGSERQRKPDSGHLGLDQAFYHLQYILYTEYSRVYDTCILSGRGSCAPLWCAHAAHLRAAHLPATCACTPDAGPGARRPHHTAPSSSDLQIISSSTELHAATYSRRAVEPASGVAWSVSVGKQRAAHRKPGEKQAPRPACSPTQSCGRRDASHPRHPEDGPREACTAGPSFHRCVCVHAFSRPQPVAKRMAALRSRWPCRGPW